MITTLALLLVRQTAGPTIQADPVVDAIIKESKTNSKVMAMLTEVTSKYGPRLTSSTNLDKASQWAMATFRKMGCKNVHLEPWGSFPVGFDRGRNSFGRMNSPEKRDFEFTSPSWSEGTRGPLKGKAVLNPKNAEELTARLADLRGAWVIMDRQPRRLRANEKPSAEVQAQIDLDAKVDAAGIAGRVYGSRSDLVITSGNFRDKTYESHPTDRSVTVRKSDFDAIQKALTDGKPIELEFNLDQRWRKGPVVNSNIIAEIPGTEKPEEVVIVSGHFDSWDGPGSVGASDNGTGSCTAMEAARLLLRAGAKPKRTIRFILWTGEEQGLFGSRSYVIQHEKELDKISAVFVDDGGSNYNGGYTGHPDMGPVLEAAFAPAVEAFPDLPMKFVVRANPKTNIGSDQDSFNAVGVPGFFTSESSVEKYGAQNYNFIHHTQHDNLKYVIPIYLDQTAVSHAVVAWRLANNPGLLPRYPKFDYTLNPSAIPGFPGKTK
jgi:hypothetical protein